MGALPMNKCTVHARAGSVLMNKLKKKPQCGAARYHALGRTLGHTLVATTLPDKSSVGEPTSYHKYCG